MIIISIFISFLALGLFLFYETKKKIVLLPMFLVSIYMLLRVLPGFLYSYYSDIYNSQYIFIIYIVAIFALMMSFIICDIFLSNNNNKIKKIKKGEIILINKRLFNATIIISVMLILSGIYLYEGLPLYIKNISNIIDGSLDSSKVAMYRKYITKGHYFGESYRGQGIIRTFQNIGWSLVLSNLYLMYHSDKNNMKYRYVFYCTFVISFFFITGDGTRGPLLLVLLTLFATYSYVNKIKIINLVYVILSTILLFIVISSVNNKLKNDGNIKEIVKYGLILFIERVAYDNSINDVHTIRLIEENKLEYKYGRNILTESLNAIPGYNYGKPFANELFQIMGGDPSSSTYSTGTNIMRSYVDFGILGVFVNFFIGGILINIHMMVMNRKKNTVLNLSWYANSTILLGQFYSIGLIGVIISIIVLNMLIVIQKIIISIKIYK